jgi:hypothetical protein
MKPEDRANVRARGLILFWLLGYPIGLFALVAWLNLKLL